MGLRVEGVGNIQRWVGLTLVALAATVAGGLLLRHGKSLNEMVRTGAALGEILKKRVLVLSVTGFGLAGIADKTLALYRSRQAERNPSLLG